jgi:hypothetical protein
VDYSDKIEGYEPAPLPFQPLQRQDFQIQQPRPTPPVRPAPAQKVQAQARMPKEQALEIVRRMKKGIIIGSLLCFGTTVGLIVNQTNNAAASQASTTTSSQSSSSSKTSTTAQNDDSTQANTSSQGTSLSGGWQQEQQGGGYGFGSTNAGQAVSGSHTS